MLYQPDTKTTRNHWADERFGDPPPCSLLWFSCQYLRPPSVWPHLFCGIGHEKRRGEQFKWSLAFRLYIGSFVFVFHVHSYQDQFIQPGWAECVLYLAYVCILCLYRFNLFVCPYPFAFP